MDNYERNGLVIYLSDGLLVGQDARIVNHLDPGGIEAVLFLEELLCMSHSVSRLEKELKHLPLDCFESHIHD